MSKDILAKTSDLLKKGDFFKADKILADAEATEELTLQEFANVAFTRGEIAAHELRWKDAAEHYARAVRLDSNFKNLIRAQFIAYTIGDYESALSFGMEAKKVAIAEYGEESEEHAKTLNNLGETYSAQGKIKEIEPLHKEALRIRKKIFGENHLLTASSFANLGGAYSSQGKYKEAELFIRKALEISKKILGVEHPNIATSLNSLGTTYEFQGNYKKAESSYKQALDIRKKTLGKNHPDIASSFNNLAVLYEKKTKHRDVESFYLRAINILESNFGSEHPDTKLVQGNYERFINASARVANSAGAPA